MRWPERTVRERFEEKVDRTGLGGCWNWMAYRNRKGYGMFSVGADKSPMLASRMAYQLNVGQIPNGMFVCHRCDNPACVRPDHLFLGTDGDNTRDMIAKGRSRQGQFQRLKTHCPRGHAYDESNTRIYRRMRHCRSCDKNRRIKQ